MAPKIIQIDAFRPMNEFHRRDGEVTLDQIHDETGWEWNILWRFECNGIYGVALRTHCPTCHDIAGRSFVNSCTLDITCHCGTRFEVPEEIRKFCADAYNAKVISRGLERYVTKKERLEAQARKQEMQFSRDELIEILVAVKKMTRTDAESVALSWCADGDKNVVWLMSNRNLLDYCNTANLSGHRHGRRDEEDMRTVGRGVRLGY